MRGTWNLPPAIVMARLARQDYGAAGDAGAVAGGFVCFHLRSSAANIGVALWSEISQNLYWPQMNADERR
jgi:hypothetical protein